MKATFGESGRTAALARAVAHSGFLRSAADRWPEGAATFIAAGSEKAVGAALELGGDQRCFTLRASATPGARGRTGRPCR